MRNCFSLLVAMAFAPLAHAKVELRDIQYSHGLLGPERKNTEFIQGDEVFVRFVVAGCQTDDEGRLRGEMSFILLDAKGKPASERFTAPIQQIPAFGAETFPARLSLQTGLELKPGAYSIEIEFKDLIGGTVASAKKQLTCKSEEFAIVAIRCFYDEQSRVPAAYGGVVGQTLFLRMLGIGFDRTKDEIDMEMTIEVLDLKGKPLAKKPVRAVVHIEDPTKVRLVPYIKLTGELTLNRPGDFLLRVTLNDTVAKKKTTFETPLHVAAP